MLTSVRPMRLGNVELRRLAHLSLSYILSTSANKLCCVTILGILVSSFISDPLHPLALLVLLHLLWSQSGLGCCVSLFLLAFLFAGYSLILACFSSVSFASLCKQLFWLEECVLLSRSVPAPLLGSSNPQPILLMMMMMMMMRTTTTAKPPTLTPTTTLCEVRTTLGRIEANATQKTCTGWVLETCAIIAWVPWGCSSCSLLIWLSLFVHCPKSHFEPSWEIQRDWPVPTLQSKQAEYFVLSGR